MGKTSQKLRSISRPIRHRLLLIFLYLLTFLFERLPLATAQYLGRFLGRILSKILTPTQKLIDKHITLVFASYPLPKRFTSTTELKKAQWQDLGRRLGEWLAGPQSLSLFKLSSTTKKQLDEIQKRANEGHAQILLTAHFGQWELMAAYLSRMGYDFVAVASHHPSHPLGRWIKSHRQKLGILTVHPFGGAKTIKNILKDGNIVALLVDQSTKEKSAMIPFFGSNAPMSLTADRLAHAFSAQVHWITNHYTDQHTYLITVVSLDHPLSAQPEKLRDASQSDQKDLEQLDFKDKLDPPNYYILQAHHHLEQMILLYPEQWIWLHQRWTKRQNHSL